MKSIKILITAALFTGLTSLSIAGPGSDYWAQQTKVAKARKEQSQVQTKSGDTAQACSHCGGCGSVKKS